MNGNVHSESAVWNLGLIRVTGSCLAEKCIQLLTDKLAEFGLCLDSDKVVITTYDDSVMKKLNSSVSLMLYKMFMIFCIYYIDGQVNVSASIALHSTRPPTGCD